MNQHVCPVWVGYLLLNPLRRFLENPEKMFAPYIQPGAFVLEPGCGPGFFTLPLARMVGREGRVVAVDIQQKMLDIVRRRSEKADLSDRIDLRLTGEKGMDLDDLAGRIDLAVAMHMVHEVPDKEVFFREVSGSLKSGGRLLMVEPKAHISVVDYEAGLNLAESVGFKLESPLGNVFCRGAVLIRE